METAASGVRERIAWLLRQLALRVSNVPTKQPRSIPLWISWAAFLVLAYLPNWAPARSINLPGLTIFWAFFAMTFIILCDQVTVTLEGSSLLEEMTASRKAWCSFLAIGALSGLLLDGIAQWLGKLWIYPYWNTAFYAGSFVIGFCAYWLAMTESYLAVRALLRRWFPSPTLNCRLQHNKPALFRTLGLLGAVLMLTGIVLLLQEYRPLGGYQFNIQLPVPLCTSCSYFLLAWAGLCLLLEWAQYESRRSSLLQSLLRGQWRPLAALLIASACTSVLWETVNAAHHFWVYTNWPFPAWQWETIPVAVLIAWPAQYVVFVSLPLWNRRDLWQ